MTAPTQGSRLKEWAEEKAERLCEEMVGTNYSVPDLIESALLEAMAEALGEGRLEEEGLGQVCTDSLHDERWCSTCDSILIGIGITNDRLDDLKRSLSREEGSK